jgi:hypothetical protein
MLTTLKLKMEAKFDVLMKLLLVLGIWMQMCSSEFKIHILLYEFEPWFRDVHPELNVKKNSGFRRFSPK